MRHFKPIAACSAADGDLNSEYWFNLGSTGLDVRRTSSPPGPCFGLEVRATRCTPRVLTSSGDLGIYLLNNKSP